MEEIKIEEVDLWFAKFKASRGLNQSFGNTTEEAVQNLEENEKSLIIN
jgi:predicted RNase H-like HicB family nuclease